jgi:hypothetical protein
LGVQEDKAAQEARLAELSAHCRDVQMLKFGQEIDVNMLDGIGLRNKTADDLREVLKGQVSLSCWHHHIATECSPMHEHVWPAHSILFHNMYTLAWQKVQ